MKKIVLFAALLLAGAACSKKEDATPVVVAPSVPSAAFWASRMVVEPNEAVSFYNVSTNATRYEWRSSDNPTQVIPSNDRVMAFAAVGNYTITLTAFNAQGQSNSTTRNIRVGKRYLTEIRLTAMNFARPNGQLWSPSGPSVFVQFGSTSVAPTQTGVIYNIQPGQLPLIWTPTAGLPVLDASDWQFYFVNRNPNGSLENMFGGPWSMISPSANRDIYGSGSYVIPSTDGRWNSVFSYVTQ